MFLLLQEFDEKVNDIIEQFKDIPEKINGDNNCYKKYLYLAMLSEQCSMYKEMVEFSEEYAKQNNYILNSDERNLLSIAFKNFISNERKAYRTTLAYEKREEKKDKSSYLDYIVGFKKYIRKSISKKFDNMLKTIENLIEKSKEDEEKVFFWKMKGDYFRYYCEYVEGEQLKILSDNCLKAYEEAKRYAKNLSLINSIRLALYLNFSVFLYEILNDHKKAKNFKCNTISNFVQFFYIFII